MLRKQSLLAAGVWASGVGRLGFGGVKDMGLGGEPSEDQSDEVGLLHGVGVRGCSWFAGLMGVGGLGGAGGDAGRIGDSGRLGDAGRLGGASSDGLEGREGVKSPSVCAVDASGQLLWKMSLT